MVRAAAESIRYSTTPPAERAALKPLGRDSFKRFATTNPRDTWNFDECGFRIGIGGSQDVLIIETFKAAQSPSETNRDFILMHFDKYTKERRVGEWRLLIFDGYGSHLTNEFITYCFENKIWPYALPPYSSHELQPLDVVVFQLYKYWHKKRVELAVRVGIEDFNKVEFLHAVRWMRKQAFKLSTIKAAFKKTGIWLLDKNVVLERLPTIDARAAISPLQPPAQLVSPSTPVTAVDIVKYTREIGLLNHRVTKLSKAAVAVAAAREKAEQDLRAQTVAARHRQRRQVSDRRVV
ncbi:DDE-domain-containing protein [Zopfia rhizophila CBS 207.26]|uniref:DDE-domain-containing protein n=1 Tax=Zopfia rhizophila CBS 207.26 TaxID=1314779 RepID=A0A6A6EQE3_9PEZI|nr:DDE-domain-containing protein [Zopfia rhizophila CBS 207.26]